MAFKRLLDKQSKEGVHDFGSLTKISEKFLNPPGASFLSLLVYCVYLLHPVIIQFDTGSALNPLSLDQRMSTASTQLIHFTYFRPISHTIRTSSVPYSFSISVLVAAYTYVRAIAFTIISFIFAFAFLLFFEFPFARFFGLLGL